MTKADKKTVAEAPKDGVQAAISHASVILNSMAHLNTEAKDANESKASLANDLVETVKGADKLGTNPATFFDGLFLANHWNTKAFDAFTQKTIVIERKAGKAPATVSTYRSKITKAFKNNGMSMDGIATMKDVTRLYNPKTTVEALLSEKLTTLGKQARQVNKKNESYGRQVIGEIDKILSALAPILAPKE